MACPAQVSPQTAFTVPLGGAHLSAPCKACFWGALLHHLALHCPVALQPGPGTLPAPGCTRQRGCESLTVLQEEPGQKQSCGQELAGGRGAPHVPATPWGQPGAWCRGLPRSAGVWGRATAPRARPEAPAASGERRAPPGPGEPALTGPLPGTSGGLLAAGGRAAPRWPAPARGAAAGKEQQRHRELWRRNRGSRAPRRINNS